MTLTSVLLICGVASAVALLARAVLMLQRIHLQLQRQPNSVHDSLSPCFSPADIEAQMDRIGRRKRDFDIAYNRLESLPEWSSKTRPFKPAGAIAEQMENICVDLAKLKWLEMRYELMIEANLQVVRGEATIAEARGRVDAVPEISPLSATWKTVDASLEDWVKRLNADDAEMSGREKSKHEEATRVALQAFKEWQNRREPWVWWRLLH